MYQRREWVEKFVLLWNMIELNPFSMVHERLDWKISGKKMIPTASDCHV